MRPIISLLLILAGCGDPGDPPCVVNLDTNCAALFDPPTFTELYTQILHPTCASGTGTCHTRDFAPRGLVFENQNESYQLLLGSTGSKVRVLRGDPACSILIKRIHATDSSYRMPPGNMPLSQPQICSFVKWIAMGASP